MVTVKEKGLIQSRNDLWGVKRSNAEKSRKEKQENKKALEKD